MIQNGELWSFQVEKTSFEAFLSLQNPIFGVFISAVAGIKIYNILFANRNK